MANWDDDFEEENFGDADFENLDFNDDLEEDSGLKSTPSKSGRVSAPKSGRKNLGYDDLDEDSQWELENIDKLEFDDDEDDIEDDISDNEDLVEDEDDN
jgi:hypothetical protein